MKLAVTALAALFLGTAGAYADEPAKITTIDGAKVYTDASGMTLYTFDKDTSGKSTCEADCAIKWPPFKADANAKAEGTWTLIKRADGTMMWGHDGKPLYTYQGDKKAGDMAGNGVGGVWHLAKAS